MSTKRYAVIGDPVAHSLSPLMHTGWIADHGLDATYEAHLLRSDDPAAAIRGLTQFAGMNITVPHKEAAARAADRSVVSVANVLRRETDATLSAFNTDGAGFLGALDEAAPQWRHARNAFILGAGGAARGIAEALASHIHTLTIANRTEANAQALASCLPNAQALSWDELAHGFAQADLIVQTTTLGMTGQPPQIWPLDACKSSCIVVDIVYRPLETPLLKAARERGLVVVDGLGMLIHQGALAFEIWHGVRPDSIKARERLLKALA
jgi:shikimate dehydrogenase